MSSASASAVRWLTATILIGFLAPACGNDSTAPSPSPPTTARPNLTIASLQIAVDSRGTGYQYRTTLQLRESAGVNATIVSVDLAFMRGSTTLASSHDDRPLAEGATVCPASGAISTRELVTTDVDPAHPYAATASATVTFSDGNGFTATATGTADVPPPPSQTQTYSLTGTITDAATHAAIGGARVEALTGANAGKAGTTDASGRYVIDDLVAETFRARASASRYNPGEQNVTVPVNSRADFELQPIAQAPCAYTVTSNAPAVVSWEGGQFTIAIARTSGTCGWTASAGADWISFPQGASGSGSATLTFAVSGSGLNSRSSTITVSWSDGSADVAVVQGPRPDWECFVGISKVSGDFDNVPSGGGTLTVSASVYAVPSGWRCTAAVGGQPASWIAGGGDIDMPTIMTFTIAPNPSPGASRTGSIVISGSGKRASVSVTQR